MKWLKRITGTFLTVLGTIGVVCSLAGIIAVWVIRGRVDNAVAEVFDRVDVAIGKLEVRAEGTTERISNSRDSLHQLNARVQQRVAQRKDVPATEAADIDEVERRLYAGIDRARDWIRMARPLAGDSQSRPAGVPIRLRQHPGVSLCWRRDPRRAAEAV